MRLRIYAVLAVTLSASIVVRADTYQFSFSGAVPDGDTISFDLPSSPTPDESGPFAFVINDVAVNINGATATWNIEFDAGGESFVLYNGTATDDTTLDSDTPPPIWTGSTASPSFTLGSYAFNEGTDSKTASGGTLLITDVSAVTPEPSSIALLGTALLAALAVARWRVYLRARS